MQHYPQNIHTHAQCVQRKPYRGCACSRARMSSRSGSQRGYSGSVASLSRQRLWRLTEEMLCPLSMWGTLMFAVKERFQYNKVSTRHRHMLNTLARHQWVDQKVVTDICICFMRVVCFTAQVNCMFLHVWPCRMRIHVCICRICQLDLLHALARACACDTAFKYFQKLDFPGEMTGVISSVRDENKICIQLVTPTTLKF